jgi:hypothetical protein
MATDIILYMLKANGIFIILYLFYVVCFSRLTFHRLNRVFLMAMLPLSLVIPVLNIGLVPPVSLPKTELPQVFDDFREIGNAVETNTETGFQWDIGNICFLIYCVVVLFFIIRLILNVFRIIQMKRRSVTTVDGKYSIISADVPSAFSCFNWIFIPPNNDSTIAPIIEHEKLHDRAYHTLDLITTELFIVFFWFNPFVYLFRRSLKTVHEFQTDSLFLKSNYKTSDYLQLMLKNLNFSAGTAAFCNHFNGSIIKKRINMMTKNRSSKWKAGRYLLLLPLITLMTMSFSVNNNHDGEIPGISPIKAGYYNKISSGYGMRIHPFTRKENFHIGIDFAAKTGTPVVATAGGVVTRVVFLDGNYGKLVEIDHENGFVTRYAQMDDFAVKGGDRVKTGDVIGYVGQSGLANGPHLHYEVWKDRENVNPADYIQEQN